MCARACVRLCVNERESELCVTEEFGLPKYSAAFKSEEIMQNLLGSTNLLVISAWIFFYSYLWIRYEQFN